VHIYVQKILLVFLQKIETFVTFAYKGMHIFFSSRRLASSRVWSPEKYLRFEDERLRPAIDLLNQIPNEHVDRVADLGCGTGNMAPHFRHLFSLCFIS
jgi:SAM-dependent methyltransferase